MAKVFIVIGCHRSGTSLTTAMLQAIGVHIGDRLIGATPHNPYGHFENIEFTQTHERWLSSLGKSWHDPPSRDEVETNVSKFLPEAQELIEKHQRLPMWGWKDPRNTVFLPVYLSCDYLKNIHIVICTRNSHGVAVSIRNRNNFPIDYCFSIVEKYAVHLTKCISDMQRKKIPHIFMRFENYFMGEDISKAEVARLVNFVLGRHDKDLINKAWSLVDPNLGKNSLVKD